MSSLPYPTDATSTCAALHPDGCPRCVVNVEPPAEIDRAPDRCVAAYCCTDCGHSWATSWGCA